MSLQLSGALYRYDLEFKEPAMTSRGTYYTHTIWYPIVAINLTADNGKELSKIAIGECAPLPDLSSDFLCFGHDEQERTQGYESKLVELFDPLLKQLFKLTSVEELLAFSPDFSNWLNFPSALMGAETLVAHVKSLAKAMQDSISSEGQSLHSSVPELMLWDNAFSRNEEGVLINGLIWMGDFKTMGERIKAKLSEGFRCIKLKIGAIDFDKELELLSYIRERFSVQDLELRVDANGAFSPSEAMDKLKALSKFELHSIEQPIKAGQYDEMAKLCADTPIAIGLDEEMIGIYERQAKITMLDAIKPQYLVIKPSLHGGFKGTAEWIELAKERSMGYWLTSALESTIGLNAIAQWCAQEKLTMPQGLGIGALYTNNLNTPMYIKDAKLNCNLNLLGMQNYSDYLKELLESKAVLVTRFV